MLRQVQYCSAKQFMMDGGWVQLGKHWSRIILLKVGIMAYSAPIASCFYGPLGDAWTGLQVLETKKPTRWIMPTELKPLKRQ